MSPSFFRSSAIALLAVVALLPGAARAGRDGANPRAGFDQFIVKFKDDSVERGNANARQRILDAGAKARGLSAHQEYRLGVGADVVRLNGKLDYKGAEDFLNRLRANPHVQYAEIDRVMKPTFTPNDTYYLSNQWHYFEATGGANLPGAWDQATGSGVVVAVLDTGVTAHPDLTGNIVAGYDFIKVLSTANDGDGRDADPSDPGDWTLKDECKIGDAKSDSSWHGTHVAGTIAALTNNSKGVAGVAFNARVMPLRVLGKCGGLSSDISDAIYWAAGGAVAGVPNNANPVEVINMSLGGAGTCGAATQAAITYAFQHGITVVVSSGNDNADASGYEPANCANVVTVGATDRAGAHSSFGATAGSNFGAVVDVSAPGGGSGSYVASTFNTGTTVPVAAAYAGYQGTSMSAPHVSGLVALMQSLSVSTPADVEAVLKSTARALPVACPQGCGAGIINGANAVGAVGAGALTVDDVFAYEGNAGTTTVTFTVSLTKAMPGPVSFDVATANGSAGAGVDYQTLSMPGQVIAAGVRSKTFSVTLNGDTGIEGDETFFLNVSNVAGIAVADGQGLGTIVNDDPIPLANGVAATGLTAPAGQLLLYAIDVPAGRSTLDFSTGGGSGGTEDADLWVKYGAIPTSAVADCKSEGPNTTEACPTFNAPAAGRWFVVVRAYTAIAGVNLTATYAPGASASLSISDASVSEGNAGTKQLGFSINLSAALPGPVTFDIATDSGTAFPGEDFVAASQAGFTIPAGQTSGTFNVTINGDTSVEDNETFPVYVTHVVGATVADDQATGRIVNDDLASLSIGDASIVEGNSGLSTMVFEVQLSQPMPSPVTFDVSTSNGSAVAGSDYVFRNLAGRYIDAGRTRVFFEVAVNGDATAEANEAFNVTVSNVGGAVPGDVSAVGTIVNDDGGGLVAGPVQSQSVRVSPVVLGFDGLPLQDDEAASCRPAGQRRGRLEPALPVCGTPQAAAKKAARN